MTDLPDDLVERLAPVLDDAIDVGDPDLAEKGVRAVLTEALAGLTWKSFNDHGMMLYKGNSRPTSKEVRARIAAALGGTPPRNGPRPKMLFLKRGARRFRQPIPVRAGSLNRRALRMTVRTRRASK